MTIYFMYLLKHMDVETDLNLYMICSSFMDMDTDADTDTHAWIHQCEKPEQLYML